MAIIHMLCVRCERGQFTRRRDTYLGVSQCGYVFVQRQTQQGGASFAHGLRRDAHGTAAGDQSLRRLILRDHRRRCRPLLPENVSTGDVLRCRSRIHVIGKPQITAKIVVRKRDEKFGLKLFLRFVPDMSHHTNCGEKA